MLGSFLQRVDRLQHDRLFKIIASIVVLLLGAAVFGTFAVNTAAGDGEGISWVELPDDMPPEQRAAIERQRATIEASVGQRSPLMVVGLVTLVAVGLWLLIIWLGLTLTALALHAGVAAAAIVGLLYKPAVPYAVVVAGVCILTAAFVALLQGARALLSYEHPVLAVAKNVLAEAVRLKLSVLLIVLFMLLLAAMPLLLSDDQPLRYRVQSFLQWATGASFWIIAILVLFFSVATVTFEQRDRIIWQTMTKPVSPWSYLLGKWLGVSVLAAILLAVCSTGVFAFTEGLRQQRAVGESEPFVSADDSRLVSEDRQILQDRVLVARKAVVPKTAFEVFEIDMQAQLTAEIERQRRERNDPDWRPNQSELNQMAADVEQQISLAYQSIPPGGSQRYIFEGLTPAKESGRQLTFRYKIDAEGNRPDKFYYLSFIFNGVLDAPNRSTGLGYSHTLSLPPSVIADNGVLEVVVDNGAVAVAPNGRRAIQEGGYLVRPNDRTITFPASGLEISYVVGGYEMNFVRVVAVLWVKLAFLAAVGVWTGTFLSFPVASLLSMGTFIMAEGTSYVATSLETFGTKDHDGNTEYWRVIAGSIARQVTNVFRVYSELKPTTRLADGLLLSWGDVAFGAVVLGGISLVLYVTGGLIFKRRELAVYSGH